MNQYGHGQGFRKNLPAEKRRGKAIRLRKKSKAPARAAAADVFYIQDIFKRQSAHVRFSKDGGAQAALPDFGKSLFHAGLRAGGRRHVAGFHDIRRRAGFYLRFHRISDAARGHHRKAEIHKGSESSEKPEVFGHEDPFLPHDDVPGSEVLTGRLHLLYPGIGGKTGKIPGRPGGHDGHARLLYRLSAVEKDVFPQIPARPRSAPDRDAGRGENAPGGRDLLPRQRGAHGG